MTFIVDMACQGTRAILYEVIPFLRIRDCELPKFLYIIRRFKFPNHIHTLLKLPLTLHFVHTEYFPYVFRMILRIIGIIFPNDNWRLIFVVETDYVSSRQELNNSVLFRGASDSRQSTTNVEGKG